MTSPSERMSDQIAAERNEAYALLRAIVGATKDAETMLITARFLGMDANDIIEARRSARGLPAAQKDEPADA
jgi:hypothetical protein